MLHLKHITLHNYRNLDNISISFSDDDTFIVGENNIGKSNLLHAIANIFTNTRFIYDDFQDETIPLTIDFSLKIDDSDIGIFRDLTTPENEHIINIKAFQESPEDYLYYFHQETGEQISKSAIKSLLTVSYDSLRNPKYELDFNKGRHAGTFLNFLVQKYISENEDTCFIDESTICSLEQYVTEMLNKIAPIAKFNISAEIESNPLDMLTRLLVLKDINGVDVLGTGYGVQYSLLLELTILEKIVDLIKSSKSNDIEEIQTLLLFDEPEIHFHPYLQRAMMKDIKMIASGEDEGFNKILEELFGIKKFYGQIIVVTHSPYIISDDFSQVVRVYKKNGDVEAVSTVDFVEEISSQERTQLNNLYSIIKEAIFSRGILIFEGQTEREALPYFAEKIDVDINSMGIGFVDANGADSIAGLQKLFDKLGISTVCLMDKDKKSKWEGKIQNLFFTNTKCFESELVTSYTQNNEYEKLKELLLLVNSNAFRVKLEKNSYIKKFKPEDFGINWEPVDIMLGDVSYSDSQFELLYSASFSYAKGAVAGKIIGQNIIKNAIPDIYKQAINKIVELVTAESF